MAEQPATLTYVKNGLLVNWGTLANGDTGEWVEVYEWPTLSPQPASNASIVWQGANDVNDTPVTLDTFEASSPSEQGLIFPRYRYVRPSATGSVDCSLFAARQF